MKRLIALGGALAMMASILTATAAPAGAAACPAPEKDGKTIGSISVGQTKVDVKSVTYPAGGVMLPPNSPINAGVSKRHMPLSSPVGSSIIVWHVNYNGCIGKLNVIMKQKIGTQFSVVDEKGFTQTFKITRRVMVLKGKYPDSWFRLDGPRQLVMVTCTGVVRNGHYDKNWVVIATPVKVSPGA